jgi:hypothetical protein
LQNSADLSEASTSPTPTPTPKPSHTGAIAGGVVGGVLAILAIIAGIFFLLRSKKRREPVTAVDDTPVLSTPAVTYNTKHDSMSYPTSGMTSPVPPYSPAQSYQGYQQPPQSHQQTPYPVGHSTEYGSPQQFQNNWEHQANTPAPTASPSQLSSAGAHYPSPTGNYGPAQNTHTVPPTGPYQLE